MILWYFLEFCFLEHTASVRPLQNRQIFEWPHKYYSNCNSEILYLMFNFSVFMTVYIHEKKMV